jgi:hypothetical protein
MYEKGSKAAGSGALTPGARPNALKCELFTELSNSPLREKISLNPSQKFESLLRNKR